MYLNDVYFQLASGELSQLSIGQSGTIDPAKQEQVNHLIRAGLNDLNKHFMLREKDLLLRTNEAQKVYVLVPANTVSSGNTEGYIIDDVGNPFLGDVMQIIALTDSYGKTVHLNGATPIQPTSESLYNATYRNHVKENVILQAFNTLKFNDTKNLGDLIVTYKASFTAIPSGADPTTYQLDIPEHYLNALTLYVASRFYNPMGAETIGRGMFHEGNNYWSKYLEEIATLKSNTATLGTTGENTNFYQGGWA